MKKENGNNKSYYQAMRSRYLNAAKESSTSGDRVMAEYNLQYAEHYSRLMAEKAFAQYQSQQNQNRQQQQSIPNIEEQKIDSKCMAENAAELPDVPEIEKSVVKKQNVQRCSKKKIVKKLEPISE